MRAQTGDINTRRDPSGVLDRAGLMRLGQASKSQADLARQVQQAHPSANDEAVQRSLDAVASQMQGTAREMQAGSSGQPVLDSQQHAAQTLSTLADALERAAQDGQGRHGSRQNAGEKSPADASGAQQQSQADAGSQQKDGNKSGDNSKKGQGSGNGQKQGEGSGQKQAGGQRGNQGGSQAARDSSSPGQQAAHGAAGLPSELGQVTAWGFLPPNQRREVLQGMQAEPPARYRKLAEHYWQLLNDSGQDGTRQ